MPPYNIQERTFEFACRVVDFCRPLFDRGVLLRELTRQLLRAGTSIGANMQEADGGESKPDFRHKVGIARKEALETRFWIRLLHHADKRLEPQGQPLLSECGELIAILTTIKKNADTNNNRGAQ
jgi:four helix bundle protein